MNSLIRILFVILAPFSLYLTACAEADHEKGSNTIEKVMIKESVIDTTDSKNGMTFSYAEVLEKATPSVVSCLYFKVRVGVFKSYAQWHP